MTSVTKNKPNKKTNRIFGSFGSGRSVLYLRCAQVRRICESVEHSSTALKLWISFRPISTCQLNALPRLHLTPIYLILSKGSV